MADPGRHHHPPRLQQAYKHTLTTARGEKITVRETQAHERGVIHVRLTRNNRGTLSGITEIALDLSQAIEARDALSAAIAAAQSLHEGTSASALDADRGASDASTGDGIDH